MMMAGFRTPSFLKSFVPWLLLAGLLFHEWRGGKFFPKEANTFQTEKKITTTVCFTPGGECAEILVKEIEGAKRSIQVQAYSFTSAPISQALVRAHQRGVQVEAILDSSNKTEKYSAADFLSRAGISTLIDGEHAIAHNKVMVLDEETVVTGSFNFTKAAQDRNAENLVILHDAELAKFYEQNWKAHQGHSGNYSPKRRGY